MVVLALVLYPRALSVVELSRSQRRRSSLALDNIGSPSISKMLGVVSLALIFL